LQLPLFTILSTEGPRQIAFAIVHCTGGDTVIAITALSFALILVGHKNWPVQSYRKVLFVTLVLGVGYTIFSEWLNVTVRGNWAYAPDMPIVPILGTGLAPLLQWILVPLVALTSARRFAEVRR
jgi:L-cystine uptake protein TcyP (sodium:dicarboxylate symporter family)